jgi:hypothetical protein
MTTIINFPNPLLKDFSNRFNLGIQFKADGITPILREKGTLPFFQTSRQIITAVACNI